MIRPLAFIWIGVVLACSQLVAQTYRVHWSTIDGGSATSSAGQFNLSGTIGQPDASAMNDDVFTLAGGFRASGGVTPELTPSLSVRFGGANIVVLSWPNPSTGFVLQQTANMSGPGGGWTDVTQSAVINQANNEVTLPVSGQFCLFRLRHP